MGAAIQCRGNQSGPPSNFLRDKSPRRLFNGNYPPLLTSPPGLFLPVPQPRGMRPPMLRPPPPRGVRLPPRMMGRGPGVRFRRGGPAARGVQRGCVAKKRRAPNFDLGKEWVTEAIKIEFGKKEEMLAQAKGTTDKEAWALYRTQREKCTQMYHAAEMEVVGQEEDNSKKVTEPEPDKNIETQTNNETSQSQPSDSETTRTEVAAA